MWVLERDKKHPGPASTQPRGVHVTPHVARAVAIVRWWRGACRRGQAVPKPCRGRGQQARRSVLSADILILPT
eukprot:scaffold17544_cov20-Prasinocladus_malaysianus.AAC.1